MPTRNVVLTDHHQQMIDRLINEGRYQNASEVLREGLRLVERREELEAAKLHALKQAATAGFSDIDSGRYVELRADELEELFANLGTAAEGSSDRRTSG
ncbi:type II toxin-antitoxin system ParD family antitoxin [Rhizobium halophilum]|uniref:type II toxin-antitoxin system ParD family antitoxin n=1 Tax=Rhizobium halophilum TaxID=2846852 RepID=UPI001EFC5901|nr:type II toxin-antitoxin system ParD family antitoxin [Rhizobium halophilum]MCF6367892.1 type II toxin-antitoxin system ParD family antitoxin [Rhizobium halophilum]